MDIACLDHLLTEEERQSFEAQGYFIVEDALDSDQCENLVEAADQVDADFREEKQFKFQVYKQRRICLQLRINRISCSLMQIWFLYQKREIRDVHPGSGKVS